MGCDIHMYVEVRSRVVASGDARLRRVEREISAGTLPPSELDRVLPWGWWRLISTMRREELPGFKPDGELDFSGWDRLLLDAQGVPLSPEIVLWDNRRYSTFAILAGVRGWDDAPGIGTPGVPPDATKEYRAEAESWGDDGHSHHWLTVRDFFSRISGVTEELDERFVRFMEALRDRWGPDGARILFFFDN